MRPYFSMKTRSAGITDLRYGNVLDEDWEGGDRFLRSTDRRHALDQPGDAGVCARTRDWL